MLDNTILDGFLAYISNSRAIIIIWWKPIMTVFWMMLLNWALNKILRQRLSFYNRVSRKCLLNFIDSCHWLIKFDRIIWFMYNLDGFLVQKYNWRRRHTLNRVSHLVHLRANLFILSRWRSLWNLGKRILSLHSILLTKLLLHAPLLHYLFD